MRLAPTALAAPVLIMTSFATELAMRSTLQTYVTYVRTDTLPRLIYKEYKDSLSLSNDVIACRWLVVHSVMGSLVLGLYIGVW